MLTSYCNQAKLPDCCLGHMFKTTIFYQFLGPIKKELKSYQVYPAIDKLGTEITKSLYKLFFSRVNNVFFVVESIKGFVAVG